MKSFTLKFWVSSAVILMLFVFASCSGSRTSATQPNGNKAAKVGWNPVHKKDEPVRKNFIIKNKQRRILGSKPVKR